MCILLLIKRQMTHFSLRSLYMHGFDDGLQTALAQPKRLTLTGVMDTGVKIYGRKSFNHP
jgi:hypothetical protein